MEVYLLLKIKVVINNFYNYFIGKISKIHDNYRYFKTGSLPEWYKFETTKQDNYNDSKNNIKLKIIDTHCDETEIEIEKTEQVKDIIKLYCETKGIEYSENLYLSKLDLNKIDENLTIKELHLSNNQTLYIFEEDKIDFIINYDDNDFKIKGINTMTFKECINSFLEENNGDFNFTLNGEAIDINKKLKILGIKSGDKIKAEKI